MLAQSEKENIETAIRLSERFLGAPSYDAQMAAYVLRDLPIMKELGIFDLAHSLAFGNAHANDVLGIIKHLENYIAENQPPDTD